MVSVKPFGKCDLISVSDENITVEFLPFGAAVRSITVPDKNGEPVDICLGYDSSEQYKTLDACFGGTIGRCANRIGGASFEIDGIRYNVTANEGANQLHGGIEGFHKKQWDYCLGENSVTFTLDSPDGDEGFPGNLHTEVTYTVKDSTLFIDYSAVSDKDTVVNLTNHAYFNLGGHNSGHIGSHRLTVRASSYTPSGDGNVPTGEIA
jgi:aldose 1-epimerase